MIAFGHESGRGQDSMVWQKTVSDCGSLYAEYQGEDQEYADPFQNAFDGVSQVTRQYLFHVAIG